MCNWPNTIEQLADRIDSMADVSFGKLKTENQQSKDLLDDVLLVVRGSNLIEPS